MNRIADETASMLIYNVIGDTVIPYAYFTISSRAAAGVSCCRGTALATEYSMISFQGLLVHLIE